MKYLVVALVFISAGLIIYGFNLEPEQADTANKFIGSGVITLFFIAMPLFLYKESKGRNFKDYMLTDENVRKMQGRPPRDTDNQDIHCLLYTSDAADELLRVHTVCHSLISQVTKANSHRPISTLNNKHNKS